MYHRLCNPEIYGLFPYRGTTAGKLTDSSVGRIADCYSVGRWFEASSVSQLKLSLKNNVRVVEIDNT